MSDKIGTVHPDLSRFLESTKIIDWYHAAIHAKARELAAGAADPLAITRRCFEFVRDEIQHSSDAERNPVTCTASEVLLAGTGFCYAKSHLLAALLRANAIPAGLCYQRLSLDDTRPSYCLHGLNAAWLPGYGWYRMDARGNKRGVDAQFCPPVEKLAFGLNAVGERDFAEVLPAPLPTVVAALRKFTDWADLSRNLPDWDRPTLSQL